MRYQLAVTALILLTGSVKTAAQSAPPRKDVPSIFKATNGAIVTIVMANNDKPIARGTGFLVSPDGVVLTNYHVIETGNVAIVKFSDGTVLPVDGILAADKVRDLAIIKIHGNTPPPVIAPQVSKHLLLVTQIEFKSAKRSLQSVIHSAWNGRFRPEF